MFYPPFKDESVISAHEDLQLMLFTAKFGKEVADALPDFVPSTLETGPMPPTVHTLDAFNNQLHLNKLQLSDMITDVTTEQANEFIYNKKQELYPDSHEFMDETVLEEVREKMRGYTVSETAVNSGPDDVEFNSGYDQPQTMGELEGGEVEDEEGDDEDESEDDYEEHQPRGALTDVPLVLGPTEVEALPLMIHSSLFNSGLQYHKAEDIRLLQATRCQILLSQKPGQYLLRELLIFIAAWDLKEEDLFYKLMVEITGRIMVHGLLPYAYRVFAEDKDVVAPAQSILLKLVLKHYRNRREKGDPPSPKDDQTNITELESDFKADIVLINFLLCKFRQEVVPRTVAILWLQGQIRHNFVDIEDFTYNMWDMERIYEGVYQYIELFSYLNEIPAWRTMVVDFNFTFELITLIRALEENLPKVPMFSKAGDKRSRKQARQAAPESTPSQAQAPSDAVVGGAGTVERPYERPTPPYASINSAAVQYAEDEEEAAQFTWQNLKKLAVLALSSFAFNSPKVRTQVRELGGIELILACTAQDMNNPYIREHAMLCLKFLLENDEANQREVKRLFEAAAARTAQKAQEESGAIVLGEPEPLEEGVWEKVLETQAAMAAQISESANCIDNSDE